LNEVFGALTNCFFDLRSAIQRPPRTAEEYNVRVVAPLRIFEKAVYLRALWISTSWSQVTFALRTFSRLALALQIRLSDLPEQSRPPLDSIPLDLKAFENAYFAAGNAIGLALGIPDLEKELRGIMDMPDIVEPESPSSR
jgi:hypothetical protein